MSVLGYHLVSGLQPRVTWDIPVPHTVLQGLIEVRSPHLEELLTSLFSATADAACPSPASRPIVVVSSLLLQEKEEPPTPGKQDGDGVR